MEKEQLKKWRSRSDSLEFRSYAGEKPVENYFEASSSSHFSSFGTFCFFSVSLGKKVSKR
jgi:hypothetical protein